MKPCNLFLLNSLLSTSLLLSQEKTIFYSNTILPKLVKTEGALDQENVKELFFTLPSKFLPLTHYERAKAYADKKIKVTDNKVYSQTSYTGQERGYSSTIHLRIYKQKEMHKPRHIELIYQWQNPGMIDQTHSYTYRLVRKKNGWNATRIK